MKSNLLIFSLSVFLILLSISCKEQKTGQQLFEQAEQLAEYGDYVSAVDAWLGAAALGYQPSEAHYRAGMAFETELNCLDAALWHYRQAKNMAEPSSPQAIRAETRLTSAAKAAREQLQIPPEILTRLNDKDKVIELLEDRCDELTKWSKRLNDENIALRNMLLEKNN